MARVLVTGSTDGLGRAAARKLIEEGHQVILHAPSHERVSVLDDWLRGRPAWSSAIFAAPLKPEK